MPDYDATGPMGMGPRTGRGFGPCAMPAGRQGLGWRRRFGPGRGMGRYFAWNWPGSLKEQLQALKEYKQALRGELEDVEREEKELASKK